MEGAVQVERRSSSCDGRAFYMLSSVSPQKIAPPLVRLGALASLRAASAASAASAALALND